MDGSRPHGCRHFAVHLQHLRATILRLSHPDPINHERSGCARARSPRCSPSLSRPGSPCIAWGPPGAGEKPGRPASRRGCQPPVRRRPGAPPRPRRSPRHPVARWRRPHARWAPPAFLPPSDDPGPWLINLEELPSAVPMVQAAMYQLVLDRKVGEYELLEPSSGPCRCARAPPLQVRCRAFGRGLHAVQATRGDGARNRAPLPGQTLPPRSAAWAFAMNIADRRVRRTPTGQWPHQQEPKTYQDPLAPGLYTPARRSSKPDRSETQL